MKKLIYLHGFASSGASGTAAALRRALLSETAGGRLAVVAPDIPVDPVEALPFLRRLVEAEQPSLIVGSSMGGMYAQQLRGVPRICVNPAFGMSKLYSLLHVGRYRYLAHRRDGATEFHVYRETIAHFAAMEQKQFDGIDDEDRMLCFGLFGLRDDLTAASRELFAAHYPGQCRFFDGGHRLNDELVGNALMPLIREIGL